ncbi:unnamed protein product, partial [Brassica rapa subsp. trilocularis]
HCFSCRSLSHEKDVCPYLRPADRRDILPSISQSRTLDRLEASKRSQDDRKVARGHPAATAFRKRQEYPKGYHDHDQWGSRRVSHHRDTRRPLFNDHSHSERPHQQEFHKTGGSADKGPFVSPRLPASQRLSLARGSSGQSKRGDQIWVEKPGHPSIAQVSQTSKTPSPRPPREQIMITPLAHNEVRAEDRAEVRTDAPQERTSALHRLSGSASRVPLLVNGVANSDSGRLQEVEIQYLEENLNNHLVGSSGKASTSRIPAHERLSLPQSSPIRTLSEDRLLIANTLRSPGNLEGSGQSLHIDIQPAGPKRGRKPAVPKAVGKRKVSEKPPPTKRVQKSPGQEAPAKRRRVVRVQNSPRRKRLSGGLSLSWKDNIDLEILESSPNFIDTKIIIGPEPLFV